jgi:hypothetical protein
MWQRITIVAACNKADTGVGPSIASGNQVCNPNWADLDITPINIIKVIKNNEMPSGSNKLNIISKSNDPYSIVMANIPINKNISPNLLIINALSAALFANTLVYQKLIKK